MYRALEHKATKSACRDNKKMKNFPKEIEDFANQFVMMQAKRHQADYDPDPSMKFYKSSVLQDISDVEAVIDRFESVSRKDRRAFAAFVLFKRRDD